MSLRTRGQPTWWHDVRRTPQRICVVRPLPLCVCARACVCACVCACLRAGACGHTLFGLVELVLEAVHAHEREEVVRRLVALRTAAAASIVVPSGVGAIVGQGCPIAAWGCPIAAWGCPICIAACGAVRRAVHRPAGAVPAAPRRTCRCSRGTAPTTSAAPCRCSSGCTTRGRRSAPARTASAAPAAWAPRGHRVGRRCRRHGRACAAARRGRRLRSGQPLG